MKNFTLFTIFFHIFHFLGIGCFYKAEVEVISDFFGGKIDRHYIEAYSFYKNPMKDIEKAYEHIPYFLIHSMKIVKTW